MGLKSFFKKAGKILSPGYKLHKKVGIQPLKKFMKAKPAVMPQQGSNVGGNEMGLSKYMPAIIGGVTGYMAGGPAGAAMGVMQGYDSMMMNMARMPSIPGGVSVGGGGPGRMGGPVMGGIARGLGRVTRIVLDVVLSAGGYILGDILYDRSGKPVGKVPKRGVRRKGVTGRDIKGADRVAKLVHKFGFKPKVKMRKGKR